MQPSTKNGLSEPGWIAQLLLAALVMSASACRDGQNPRALVESAIEAHGGRERLAVFDNVKLVGHGRFRGTLRMTGTISFVAPDTWAAEAQLQGNPAMRFGMDGERCWRRDRQFVSDCSGNEADYRRFGEVLRLRLLHGLEDRQVTSAGERNVAGVKAPSVRVGDFTLAFDPESHRLVEISSSNWVEVYSDFRNVDGAVVAAAKTFFLDGELDVEDSWEKILPGQADASLLHPPSSPKEGDTLDEVDPERWVITTAVQEPTGDLTQAVASLDDLAQAQGRKVSAADGFVLTQLPPQQQGQGEQWEISIGLEPTTQGPAVSGSAFRFDRWPEARFANVFLHGGPNDIEGKKALLQQYMDRAGLAPAPGSRWQVICRRESLQLPPAERLCLLRLAVTDVEA